MGFVGKLFLHVSSVVLLLVGATPAKSGVLPRDGKIVRGQPGTESIKSDLFAEFLSTTKRPFTEQSVVSGIRRMVVTISPDRMQQLSVFARDIRDLGLSPDTEIKAVEILLSRIELMSDSTISEREAAQLTGQIVDQFVSPGKLAQASTPTSDKAAQGPSFQGLHPLDIKAQSWSGQVRPSQEVQLTQAGLSAPERLEVFQAIVAPEELELNFEPAAGEIDISDAYHR